MLEMMVFRWFQGAQKETSGMNWVNCAPMIPTEKKLTYIILVGWGQVN